MKSYAIRHRYVFDLTLSSAAMDESHKWSAMMLYTIHYIFAVLLKSKSKLALEPEASSILSDLPCTCAYTSRAKQYL